MADADIEGKVEFLQHVRKLLKAIELCLQEKMYVPSFMLIYAGIDGMAWLQLAKERYNVTPSDFINWVKQYLLPDSKLRCSGVDLYAARCGLLHTGTPGSSQTRSGSGIARKLFYQIEDGRILVHMSRRDKTPPIFVDVRELSQSFETAILRFKAQIETNPGLADVVYERARDYLCEFVRVPEHQRSKSKAPRQRNKRGAPSHAR